MSQPEHVPASMINETLYCERLVHLRWAQGETADNHYILDGRAIHTHADEPRPLAPPDDSTRHYQARAVWLSSDTLKITAKIDVVDVDGGLVDVIEYKRGKPPDLPEGAYVNDRAQVCAQVLLLREHGYNVRSAQIYFAAAKKRVTVVIDEPLIRNTQEAIANALRICASTEPPPPLVDNQKCTGCALVSVCLPDEVNQLNSIGFVRQLRPRRDDGTELHVQEQGARVGLRGECLVVKKRSGEEETVQLAHTSGVSVYGNVQVSTQVLREVLYRDIPICFFTTGNWYCGKTASTFANADVRVAQFRAFANTGTCLQIARGVVASKIKNCRTLLMRNGDVDDATLCRLEEAQESARSAQSLEQLLGVEGMAARTYFGCFSGMFKMRLSFDFDGRNRRPARDPVNAMLSLAYALLVKDVSLAVEKANLDPALGFYHQPRFGRPALALDLMEEFRPLVADSTVITAVNTGIVTVDDFVHSAGATALTSSGRRGFIQAYERRMSQVVTHPVFGYQISYRRVLDVQARLLGRMLLGEIAEYPAFNTR